MKRSREWQTQSDDDEPWTELASNRTTDLERAADAGTLLMPYSARVVHAVGRWPSGAAIRADVLLLGEYHTEGGVGGGMSVQQMVALAVERAAAIGECFDVFVEDAVVGVVAPAPQVQQKHGEFQKASIFRVRHWLRRIPRNHLRVHLVDSRADLAVEATGEMLDRSLPLRGQPTPWERRNARRCFAWLAGFAPPPRGVEADARSVLFGHDAEETRTWLDLHAAHALKVRKRARGMQSWDVRAPRQRRVRGDRVVGRPVVVGHYVERDGRLRRAAHARAVPGPAGAGDQRVRPAAALPPVRGGLPR